MCLGASESTLEAESHKLFTSSSQVRRLPTVWFGDVSDKSHLC